LPQADVCGSEYLKGSIMEGAPLEVWRGSAQAWECDHLGHWNTRFYLTRVELALASYLAVLKQPLASMTIEAQHIRFHREVRAGVALHATAQLVRSGIGACNILIALHHSRDGALAATFRLTVVDDLASRVPLSHAFVTALPSSAAERGLRMDHLNLSDCGLAQARALGLQRTGLTIVTSDQCDQNGRWRLSAAMGLLADCVPHLDNRDWQEVLALALPNPPGRVGGALIEFGLRHRLMPKLGDRIEVRSARTDCTDRVFRTVHWLLDLDSGAPWAVVQTVGVALDLDARKLIALTPEAQAAYRSQAVIAG
jgi:acyl-CoA thioester hydrolase